MVWKNKLYILAFVLPILSMLIVYYFKDIFPFWWPNVSSKWLLSSVHTLFRNTSTELKRRGKPFLYLGNRRPVWTLWRLPLIILQVPLTSCHYLAGLYADMVSFFIVLKMGLAGFSVCYYLQTFWSEKYFFRSFRHGIRFISLFAAFSWNIMWLDCMWLLPFIVLGLEKLVNEKNCKMYCISLALAIFSNYYIGLMICIFSIIYFVYLFCIVEFDETVRKN